MQKDTSERVVLLFDPERNELKNSFTKKEVYWCSQIFADYWVLGLNFTDYRYLYLIFTDYWLCGLTFTDYQLLGLYFTDYWFLRYPIETLMTAILILWAAPYSHINIKKSCPI